VTAAVITVPESLDWVTFSDQDDGPCDGRCRIRCPRQAVALVIWDAPCGCGPNPQRACISHRDEFAGLAAGKWRGWFRCAWCEGQMHLLRIEPLR
jgi:hypothetical protein